MDGSQEELRTIFKSENILAELIAVAIEDELGIEIGTPENAEEVIAQLQERILQTQYAISLLDPELHIVPLTALKDLNVFYHLPALQNAREKLERAKWNNI